MSWLQHVCRVSISTSLAWLLALGPMWPSAARADEPEALTFSEFTEAMAAAPREQGAATALKAREIPVDNRGAFGTSIAIDVPPGRRGMTPALAIAYSSGRTRQEGPIGVGFSLDVSSVRRSTANGYPLLERINGAAKYDDDAVGAFEGPTGRLVELDCELVPAECPPEANGRVFAPEIETAPIRYEYLPDASSGGYWVEYQPDGLRRYFGVRPSDGMAHRIQNGHGTFAWLLMDEVDRFGNAISYDYSGGPWSGGSTPQVAPVLRSIRWGGNNVLGTAHLYSAVVDVSSTEAGGADFLSGGVRH